MNRKPGVQPQWKCRPFFIIYTAFSVNYLLASSWEYSSWFYYKDSLGQSGSIAGKGWFPSPPDRWTMHGQYEVGSQDCPSWRELLSLWLDPFPLAWPIFHRRVSLLQFFLDWRSSAVKHQREMDGLGEDQREVGPLEWEGREKYKAASALLV